MHARLTAVVAVGAVVAVIAGCGDDDAPIEPIGGTTTEETTAPSAPTKREFIADADARCAEANAAIANLAATESAESLSLVAGQEQGITRGVLQGLRALGEPEDPDGAVSRYYSALRTQLQLLGQRQQAAQRGDTEAYEALGGELAQAKADARVAAEEFGFRSCGQEGSTVAPGAEGEEAVPGGEAPEPAPPMPAPPEPPEGGSPSGGAPGGDGGDGGGSGGIGAG